MYRERLVTTQVSSDSARRLQKVLLEYHDFRRFKLAHPLRANSFHVSDWQASRLKATHQDLYAHSGYHAGLEFLLTDLYAPINMTRRDDNIDRVFPKMVRWLPGNLLNTLAGLVELNLVTQRLDLELTERCKELGTETMSLTIRHYCEAYRASTLLDLRERQIGLVANVGQQLDRYIRNRTLGWLLTISRAPADMADLTDLHSFLYRGYTAFRRMDNVQLLIERLVTREKQVMDNILNNHPDPFRLPGDL